MKKQLLYSIIGLIMMKCACVAADTSFIEKTWEMDISDIFTKSKLANTFAPSLAEKELVFGSLSGRIKTVDAFSKEIKSILKIPLTIERSLSFDSEKLKNFVVFYGVHKLNGKTYYCSIDLNKRKIKGVVSHKRGFLSFGQFAIFEKNNNFIVFNPKVGRGVYRQYSEYKMEKSIYSQNARRYVFQTENKEIIDISIPKFGASIIMSPKGREKDVLMFTRVAKLDEDMVADNINDEILYYHRHNGKIGLMDVEKGKIIWEKKYFKSDMSIQGPHVFKDKLIYLVSYPFKETDTERKGKLICLNKKSGKANWISKDLPFNNFGIAQFDEFVLSSDTEGNLLFLNISDGQVKEKVYIGEGVSTPIIEGQDLYVVTKSRIYKFKNNRISFKMKLLMKKLKEKIT